MLLANKIKESEEFIENRSHGFKTFLESLRSAHLKLSFPRSQQQSIHQSEPLPDHERPSEPNRSQILHFNHSEHELDRPLANLSSGLGVSGQQGDKIIKNKLRVGVANRQRANCFRLPSYCFELTKQELGSHLKEVKKDAPKVVMEVVRRGQAQRGEQLSEKMQKKGPNDADKPKSISAFNPNLVFKYCSINQINSSSSLKQVLVFFTRLLQLLSYKLPEPKIERYRNCVYFGQPIRKNQIYEGIVYQYSGIIYFGELLNNQKQGVGVEIDINKNTIYKGEFMDGQMVGYFEVQKDQQKYYGEVSQGKYHGYGKLIDNGQVFEGEFKYGQKVSGSTHKYGNTKDLWSSRVNRRDQSFWSTQKQLKFPRGERFQFSNNKIHPIKNINRGSHMQFQSTSERKRSHKRYAEQTREFSYPLNHEMEGSFNPQIGQMINSKKASRVSSLRIREVGKLHSTRVAQPEPQEDQERPLVSKI